MKANTIQTLRRILKAQKAYAMHAGHYSPPNPENLIVAFCVA